MSVCLSVCLSICLSVRSSASLFNDNLRGPYLRAVHTASGHRFKYPEWQYNMSVNPSVSLSVRMPVRTFVCLSVGLLRFCICTHFQCGSPASRCINPHTGVQRTTVGSSQAYISVSPSLCPVVRSACGRRPRGQIPEWQYNISVSPPTWLSTGLLQFLCL